LGPIFKSAPRGLELRSTPERRCHDGFCSENAGSIRFGRLGGREDGLDASAVRSDSDTAEAKMEASPAATEHRPPTSSRSAPFSSLAVSPRTHGLCSENAGWERERPREHPETKFCSENAGSNRFNAGSSPPGEGPVSRRRTGGGATQTFARKATNAQGQPSCDYHPVPDQYPERQLGANWTRGDEPTRGYADPF
jgi:hypothetical protein